MTRVGYCFGTRKRYLTYKFITAKTKFFQSPWCLLPQPFYRFQKETFHLTKIFHTSSRPRGNFSAVYQRCLRLEREIVSILHVSKILLSIIHISYPISIYVIACLRKNHFIFVLITFFYRSHMKILLSNYTKIT